MLGGNKITSVVSVYNEEKTVKSVVYSLLNCVYIDELIVVNDGSTDNTSKILNQILLTHPFQYVEFNKNRGKSYAMTAGVEQAKGDVIVFIDADLIGLNCNHIKKLVDPLVNGNTRMVIGRRVSETNPKIDITGPLDDWLGGERAVYKEDLMPILDEMKETKFGVETLLNLYFKSKSNKNTKTLIVDLEGLVHIRKYQKYKWNQAVFNYSKSASQIIRTVFVNYFLVGMVVKNIFLNIRG